MKVTPSNSVSFQAPHSLMWLTAIGLVFLLGLCHRAVMSHLNVSLNIPVKLPIPLKEFPLQIDGWSGQDVPLPESILRIAGNDDYLYRMYREESTGHWVNVYVSYSGRPRTMVGHRPEVCYGAAGWTCDGTVRTELKSPSGLAVPCLVHRFRKPGPDGMELVVLNFYILNGQIINAESGFTGLGWRTPNIAGNPAHYVAQVQISSVLESPVRSAAESLTDLICEYLPDETGRVQAAYTNYTQAVSSSVTVVK